ncbi:6-phosphofructo-2-kinase-domain-containing protein [Pilobolus umbonatus]|nr:6-phosphofructo-2-kinase-domain-containing protein [Pilobolus umbonatus]
MTATINTNALAIITVGLPARGKTHVSRSLCRYMKWLGVSSKVYSVSSYRRERMGFIPNEMFDPANTDAYDRRLKMADECLGEMIDWLQKGGQVGIFDGNNNTEIRRTQIHQRLSAENINTLFIESICDDDEVVLSNIRLVKVSSPDYVGWDPEEVIKDYTHRIRNCELHYNTITDLTLPFVKLLNVGERLIVNNVRGYLQSRVVYFLMNIHNRPRTIYFARAGQSILPESFKIDGELSPEGQLYAERLKNFVLAYRAQNKLRQPVDHETERPLVVWTSNRKKSKQTADAFAKEGIPVRYHSVLHELNPGVVDGSTKEEIKSRYPEEMISLRENPYRHRFPRAESYHDLANRLESIIMELEREKNDVLIIAHDSILRCLYAYLFDRPDNVSEKRGDRH